MQQYSLKLDANSGFHQTKPSYSLRLALHWGDTAIKDSYLVSIQVVTAAAQCEESAVKTKGN